MIKSRFREFFAFEKSSVQISEQNGYRYLHLGSKTVQSAMSITNPTDLILPYTKAMMGVMLFVTDPKRALMVGLGGGSLPKYFYNRIPSTKIVVVEKNSEVVAVARQHFFLPENNHRFAVIESEGFFWLSQNVKKFDVIMVDGYDSTSQDERLSTEEFYDLVHRNLSEVGVLVINCWTREGILEETLKKLSSVFPTLAIIPAEKKGNVAVFAVKSVKKIIVSQLINRARSLENCHDLEFPKMLKKLEFICHD